MGGWVGGWRVGAHARAGWFYTERDRRAGLAPIASASPRLVLHGAWSMVVLASRTGQHMCYNFFREKIMATQIDKMLAEFTDQIDRLTDQLNQSIDADERDQLSFVLDEYKRVVVKLERMIIQRAMEHEKASRNQSEEL